MSRMRKLSRQSAEGWVPHDHEAVYELQEHRLQAALPAKQATVMRRLAQCLAPPYALLYVLHTPRGEAPAGRYQSPSIDREQLSAFLDRFGAYLAADARFDLWLHSFEEQATVVWDRHDLLYAYGPINKLRDALEVLGFKPGQPQVGFAHQHHYRAEFDADARALLQHWDWTHTPLQKGDEQ